MSRPCRGNEKRLIALFEGQLRPQAAERVRDHIERCAACRAGYRKLELARQTLRGLASEEPPEINYRQVEAQINWRISGTGRHAAVKRRTLGLLPAGALAAVALVLGGLFGAWLQDANTPPASSAKKPQRAIASRAAPPAPAPRAPAAAREPELAALVTLLRGTVQVATVDGTIGLLELSRPVLAGERVITVDGGVALQWADGSGIRLGPQSEVRLLKMQRDHQEVELLRGGVDAQYHRGDRGSKIGKRRFAVIGGGLRAEVKGTRFSVRLSDNHTTEVVVRQGVVAVSSLGEGWTGSALPKSGKITASDGQIAVPAGYQLKVVAKRALVARSGRRAAPHSLNLLEGWTSLHRMLAGSGPLSVQSRPPDADVFFNSAPVGRTNLKLRGVVGRHLVELYRNNRLIKRQWVQIGASGNASVNVDTRAISVSQSGLSAAILQVFRERAVQIRACYERRLKRYPKLAGRLKLRVKIAANGEVLAAKLAANTLGDPHVGRCAVAVVSRWRFPPGEPTEIVYPLALRPARTKLPRR